MPLPQAESLPYLIAGIALHFGYQVFLMQSYRIGDLTQVYPIARGSSPLLVAVVSLVFLGVVLKPLELLGVLVIAGGIISISLMRQGDGLKNPKAAALALTTGCFIAAYSLVDGFGARLSGTSLGFFAWIAISNAVSFALFTSITHPGTLRKVARTSKRLALFGGSASFVAYSLAIWAFTQAPITLVTALRETSIVFALLIGVFFLKERISLTKIASTAITIIGVIILRLA